MTYTCSMHPEVKSDRPGKCPKCGLKLVPVGTSPHPRSRAISAKLERAAVQRPPQESVT